MTVLLAEGVAITYRPAEKRAERVEVGRVQRRVFRFIGAAEPLDALKQYFSFTFRDPGAKGNYTLVLQPTIPHDQEAPQAGRARDRPRAHDRRSRSPTSEADGDTTAYRFTDIVMQPADRPTPSSASTFPPDVQVVRAQARGAAT